MKKKSEEVTQCHSEEPPASYEAALMGMLRPLAKRIFPTYSDDEIESKIQEELQKCGEDKEEAIQGFLSAYPAGIVDELESEEAATEHLRIWMGAGGASLSYHEFEQTIPGFGQPKDPGLRGCLDAIESLAEAIENCPAASVFCERHQELGRGLIDMAYFLEYLESMHEKASQRRPAAEHRGRPKSRDMITAFKAWQQFFPDDYPLAKAARIIARAINLEHQDDDFEGHISSESIRVAIASQRTAKSKKLNQALKNWR